MNFMYQNKNKPYLKIKVDVFIGDRFIMQMWFLHPRGFVLTETKLKQEVERRNPSLKGKNYRVRFVSS